MENLKATHSENIDFHNGADINFHSTMKIIEDQASTEDTTSQIDITEVNPENNSDGYIDDVKQGEANDCWLISELTALSGSQWGRNAIKNAIKQDSNGNYNIFLHGKNGPFVYNATKEKIEKARNDYRYSTGDLDVLLIELATEAYRMETLGKELDEVYNSEEDIFELITGVEPTTIRFGFGGSPKSELRNLIDKFKKNHDKYAICCAIPIGGAGNISHQCTISRFETDEKGNSYVIIKNPYDTAVEIRMTENEFIKTILSIDYLENSNYTDNNPEINSDGQIGQLKFAEKGTDKWALPAIKAISNEYPNLISDSIIYKGNGNLEITLKGVNKKYTITPAEIIKAKESGKYSSGDDDIIALEIAIERFCQREYGPADTSSSNLRSRTFDGISLATIPDSTIIYVLTGRDNMHVNIDGNGNYIISDTIYFKDMPSKPKTTVRPTESTEEQDDVSAKIIEKLKNRAGNDR